MTAEMQISGVFGDRGKGSCTDLSTEIGDNFRGLSGEPGPGRLRAPRGVRHESRYPSPVHGNQRGLQLRQQVQDRLDTRAGSEPGRLRLLPSLLYGQAEDGGYGRPGGQVPQEVRREGRYRALIPGLFRP